MPDYTLLRGDTWIQALTGLGDLTGRSKLWFTAKRSPANEDSESVFQIEESGGLLFLNGEVGTAGDGSITVTSAAGGLATVRLEAEAARQIGAVGRLFWDCQVAYSSTIVTRSSGRLLVHLDTTRDVD